MDSKKRKNITRNASVVFLITLFISVQLFEPLHYFFFSHKHHDHSKKHHHWSKTTEKECPVCKFEFCSFINEPIFYPKLLVPTAYFSCSLTIQKFFKKIHTPHKKGRGPPLFVVLHKPF